MNTLLKNHLIHKQLCLINARIASADGKENVADAWTDHAIKAQLKIDKLRNADNG